jgi:hypothetical protein
LPKFQGKGIGNSLIKNISDYRFSKVKYIVTKTNNERLKNFYVKKYKAKILSSFFSLKNIQLCDGKQIITKFEFILIFSLLPNYH